MTVAYYWRMLDFLTFTYFLNFFYFYLLFLLNLKYIITLLGRIPDHYKLYILIRNWGVHGVNDVPNIKSISKSMSEQLKTMSSYYRFLYCVQNDPFLPVTSFLRPSVVWASYCFYCKSSCINFYIFGNI